MAGLTPKQEAFCLAYVECGNASEAYRRAYDVSEASRDSWIWVEASQLLDNPKVAQRLAEIQEKAAKRSEYTISRAYEEYEEARKLAISASNPSAAVSAVAGKVKLFGLDRPARIEHTGKGGGPIEHDHDPNKAFAYVAGLLGLTYGGSEDSANEASGVDEQSAEGPTDA